MSINEGVIWGWMLAMIPPLLILQHAIFLKHKPRLVNGARGPVRADLEPALDAVRASSAKYFDTWTIALRYGIPAVVSLVIGVLVFMVLDPASRLFGPTWGTGADMLVSPETLCAARFGAAGAYCYVLVYLSWRAFRHDITTGAANWGAVTLTLGPLLAAVSAKIWGSPGPTATSTELAVYFLAGFSPRAVGAAIEEVARRTLNAGKPSVAVPDQTLPLALVRGMLPPVIERLAEEGITDVSSLAMADPVRLQRDCNYDKRQLLNWIDEALLIHFAPKAWRDLQDVGIAGAIDLGWFATAGTDDEEIAKKLPVALGDDATRLALAQLSRRLQQDAQVQLVWVLYQLETNEVALTQRSSDAARDEDVARKENAARAVTQPVIRPG